jgi:hypothetical protein
MLGSGASVEPAPHNNALKLTSRAALAIVPQVIIRAWVLNFLVFCLVASFLGGDAVNGRRQGGRYFLSDHGTLTEVSRSVWLYSRAHVYATWGATAGAILGAMVLLAAQPSRAIGGDSLLVGLMAGGMISLVSTELLKGRPGPAPIGAFVGAFFSVLPLEWRSPYGPKDGRAARQWVEAEGAARMEPRS